VVAVRQVKVSLAVLRQLQHPTILLAVVVVLVLLVVHQ
jgi:hypothetical protein